MSTRVDLRGLTCPEPVLRAKRLLDDKSVERVEALVDDEVCVNNLARLARSLKASYEASPKDGFFEVVITRGPGSAPKELSSEKKEDKKAARTGSSAVIFLAKDTFGDGDPELSRTLVNLFLQTTLESGHRVQAILLANSGVKLFAPDSPVRAVLDDFKAAGSEVLACGLCLEFYGLKEKCPKEQITNMFAICEYLFSADRVLSP